MKKLLTILLFLPFFPKAQTTYTQGLVYDYYEITGVTIPIFTTLIPVRSDTISNFTLPAIVKSNFAINFTGYINIMVDNTYTFYLSSDDGSSLYIDGVLLVNNDGIHAPTEKTKAVTLKSGKHLINVQFLQVAGGQQLSVKYSSPTITKQLIPNSLLFRIPNNSIGNAERITVTENTIRALQTQNNVWLAQNTSFQNQLTAYKKTNDSLQNLINVYAAKLDLNQFTFLNGVFSITRLTEILTRLTNLEAKP